MDGLLRISRFVLGIVLVPIALFLFLLLASLVAIWFYVHGLVAAVGQLVVWWNQVETASSTLSGPHFSERTRETSQSENLKLPR